MNVLLLATALLTQQQTVVSANVKDGEVVAGERQFRITVQSPNHVTQVEFYVNDELRDTDQSTPYEFRLDTINEGDGTYKLSFKAYFTKGNPAAKNFNVTVDNGFSKGLDFHVQQGTDFLADSKVDQAELEARIALKIDRASIPAKILMARVMLAKGVLDRAQKLAEDVTAAVPNDANAADLLASINLRRAFNTLNRGGNPGDTLAQIETALKAAVHTRTKVRADAFEQMGAVSDATRLKWLASAFRANRFATSYSDLMPKVGTGRPADLVNAAIFVCLKMGRLQDAVNLIAKADKYGEQNAVTQALGGVVYQLAGNKEASDDHLKKAILNAPTDEQVLACQAYVTLLRGRLGTSNELASILSDRADLRPEVLTLQSAVYFSASDFGTADKAFEAAILSDPTYADAYIERATQALFAALGAGITPAMRNLQHSTARIYLDTALMVRPESPHALVARSFVAHQQNDWVKAESFARAAVTVSPSFPPARYTLAAVLMHSARAIDAQGGVTEAQAKRREAQTQLDEAQKLDPVVLGGRQIPTVQTAMRYFAACGRAVFLLPPTG